MRLLIAFVILIPLCMSINGPLSLIDDDPFVPIAWSSVPKAQPGDYVEVRYLEAPVDEESKGQLFSYFDVFHGGVGIVNLDGGYSFTLNFDDAGAITYSLFPNITILANGTTVLNWKNGGSTLIYNGIYDKYWNSGNTLMSIINGTTLNDFMLWIKTINDSRSHYNLLAIYNQWNNGAGPLYMNSYTCVNFVWESFSVLKKLGARWLPNVKPSRDFINVYSSIAPVLVTDYWTNPQTKEKIDDFFALTSDQAKSLSWFEWIASILELTGGEFYVRNNDNYYFIQLQFPYFGFH